MSCFRDSSPLLLLSPPSNSPTLAGCPTVQLKSDTSYLEVHRWMALSQTAPAALQTPITSPDCHLCVWPTSWRSEVPTVPSLGLINLLQQLIEHRNTVYLLDYRFFIKGCNSRTATWKGSSGKLWGKGSELQCPFWMHHVPQTSTCSPTQLSEPCAFGFLMEASLYSHSN